MSVADLIICVLAIIGVVAIVQWLGINVVAVIIAFAIGTIVGAGVQELSSR